MRLELSDERRCRPLVALAEWVSEQFLNGTSAHNGPFQCHYLALRLKTKYTRSSSSLKLFGRAGNRLTDRAVSAWLVPCRLASFNVTRCVDRIGSQCTCYRTAVMQSPPVLVLATTRAQLTSRAGRNYRPCNAREWVSERVRGFV